jgi:5-methylcytosine-specific restriction endonuclease McrA
MPNRSTTIRTRHRAVIAKGKPACGICGQPIDYDLPYLDPGSFVVDHIIPVILGGTDTLDNKQAAHRSCNRTKGKRIDGAGIVRRSPSLRRSEGV